MLSNFAVISSSDRGLRLDQTLRPPDDCRRNRARPMTSTVSGRARALTSLAEADRQDGRRRRNVAKLTIDAAFRRRALASAGLTYV